MTQLGRSLGFHLKYWEEMVAIYWEDDNKSIKNLEDQDKIIEMVNTIGDNACEQAERFLRACADKVVNYISLFCNAKIRTRKSDIQIDWELAIDLWPKRHKKPSQPRCQIGLTILDPENYPADWSADWYPSLLPWVWVSDGKVNEENLAKTLNEKIGVFRSRLFSWDPGTIVLDRIRLIPKDHVGFDVEASPLVDQCMKVIRKINEKDMRRIFEIVKS